MEDIRIYVASLSDYNNGRLEGKWFDLADYSDASELMGAIHDMLKDLTKKYQKIDGEVREEWAVHDYEGIPPTLASEYMGEQDFQQLYDIAEVAEDRNIPVEVLVERAGDTGSDDYQALADSLVMVVDGNDETDIVYELESQMGDLGSEFWAGWLYIDDVTERVLYSEDVDQFREQILDENPDMDEDEAERQAEEMADEQAENRKDVTYYLEELGYSGDEIPNWVSKDYESAWKYALSYDYDVIHHDGEMYVFTNNYSVGGTILSGLVGAYIGYKIGRSKPQKKGFETEKRIGKKIKGALSKNKYAEGGDIEDFSEFNFKYGDKLDLGSKGIKYFKQYDGEKIIVVDSKADLKTSKGSYTYPSSVKKVLNRKYAEGGSIGFKGLSDKVAKRYAGKKVAPKYQGEYGKRYSKSEAKEVGDKVAGKVYWEQKNKMARGGGIKEGYAIMQRGSLRTDAFKRVEVFPTKEKALFKMSHVPNFKSLSKEEKLKLIVPYSSSKMARGGNVNTGRSWHLDRARHNKGESYEKPLNNRKRKYEDGGQIGQEIVFDDNGEENTGVIKDIHENTGNYIVATDDGRVVLADKEIDVISLGKMRQVAPEKKKRFGFFEEGGGIDEVIIINIDGYPYYLKKMDDTTHFRMANSKNGVDLVIPSHIGQHRGEQYYSDVALWLKGGQSPNGKSYKSNYYAKGGGVSGLDDLIRG